MGCLQSKAARKRRAARDLALTQHKVTWDALGLSRKEVLKLYRCFEDIDSNGDGELDSLELLMFLDRERTRFTERLFGLMDTDASGAIDFRELVVSLWNYCTLDSASLMLFCFDLLDEDSSGTLEVAELITMLQDVYGKDKDGALSELAMAATSVESRLQQNPTVTQAAFVTFCKAHPSLVFVAFDLQRVMQKKFVNKQFWAAAARKRSLHVGAMDDHNPARWKSLLKKLHGGKDRRGGRGDSDDSDSDDGESSDDDNMLVMSPSQAEAKRRERAKRHADRAKAKKAAERAEKKRRAALGDEAVDEPAYLDPRGSALSRARQKQMAGGDDAFKRKTRHEVVASAAVLGTIADRRKGEQELALFDATGAVRGGKQRNGGMLAKLHKAAKRRSAEVSPGGGGGTARGKRGSAANKYAVSPLPSPSGAGGKTKLPPLRGAGAGAGGGLRGGKRLKPLPRRRSASDAEAGHSGVAITATAAAAKADLSATALAQRLKAERRAKRASTGNAPGKRTPRGSNAKRSGHKSRDYSGTSYAGETDGTGEVSMSAVNKRKAAMRAMAKRKSLS